MVRIKKENETNRDRFVRLAETRTQKVLNALRILGYCSNLQNYEYNNDDVSSIFNEIERITKRIKNQFLNNLDRSKGKIRKFTLK